MKLIRLNCRDGNAALAKYFVGINLFSFLIAFLFPPVLGQVLRLANLPQLSLHESS